MSKALLVLDFIQFHTVLYSLVPSTNEDGLTKNIDIEFFDALGFASAVSWDYLHHLPDVAAVRETKVNLKPWEDPEDDRGMCYFGAYFLYKEIKKNGRLPEFIPDNDQRHSVISNAVIEQVKNYCNSEYGIYFSDTKEEPEKSGMMGKFRAKLMNLFRSKS